MSGHVIRVVDFETSGTEPPAQVCEVGICDLTQLADGSWDVGEPDAWLCGGIDPPDLCRALYAAFEAGHDADAVLRRFSTIKQGAEHGAN